MPSSRLTYPGLQSGTFITCLLFISIVAGAQPRVSQFSPGAGPVGTVVTINGSGFSANASSDIVFFGATRAVVSAASGSSLSVTVPAGATYQPISITVNGLTGYSAAPFVVTFPGGQAFVQAGGTRQQDAFEPEIDSSTDLHPNGVAIADFDGDGKPDIATANNFSIAGKPASISLLRNTGAIGAISFASHYEMPADVQTFAIAAGDLDGDGKPDLISCGLYSQTISVYRNTSSIGSISFAAGIDFPSGHEPFSVVIADIDLDGRPDVIVANNLGGNVSVFRNTTAGGVLSLATPVDLAVGIEPESVAVGDLDGDGLTDVVVTNQGSNNISVLRNTSSPGSISFAPRTDLATNGSPFGVAIGDLDGDNKPEIVVVNNGSSSFSIFRNTGISGSISFDSRIDHLCNISPYGVALADLNGDGKIDVFVSSANATVTQNASSPGTIAFGGQINLFTTLASYSIGIADLDGDGKSDLIAPAFAAEGVGFLRNKDNEPTIFGFSPVNAVSGTVDTIVGHFFNGVTAVTFGGVSAASYTIVNSDTILATVGAGSSGSVGVGNQNGTNRMSGFYFHVPPVVARFTPTDAGAHDTIFISGSSFTGATAVSFGGMSAASFVVNGDTSITAIVDSGSTGSVVVNTPYGVGSLAGFTYFHLPGITGFTPAGGGMGTIVTISGSYFTGITAVSIGGVPVASYTVNSPTRITATVGEGANGYLSVTSPGGTGLSDTTFSFPPPSIAVMSADSAAVGSSVTITGANFRSDPSADVVYFGAARAIVTSASTTSLTVTVPSGATYDRVTVTVNNRIATTMRPFIATYGPGASALTDSLFSWKGAFSVNEDPDQIILADLDGDGRPDILSAEYEFCHVSVLQNTSSVNHPSFRPIPDPIAAGSGSALYPVIAVGDLNADGKPDLVMAGNGYFTVCINTSTNGQVSFAAPQKMAIPYNDIIDGMTIADFDGDGRIDVAMTAADYNSSQSTLVIYRNTGEGARLSFAPGVGIGTGAFSFQIKTADSDNDGKIDIAAGSEARIDIFRNTGGPGTIAFVPAGGYASDLSQVCAVADVDGDGLQDLISAGLDNQTNHYRLSIYKNSSAGGNILFDPRIDSVISIPTLIDPIYPTVGQIDGDGKTDLVLVDAGGTNNQPFYVYRNTGGNAGMPFAGGNRYPSQLHFGYARQAVIADVDGDGKADIVVGNDVDDAVSVFRNQAGESVISLCAGADTNLMAGRMGSAYQWQVATGGAFINLADGDHYGGSGSAVLGLNAVPTGFTGYQYRCLVDGVPGTIYDLVVHPDTLLAGTASAPGHVCSGDMVTVSFMTAATVPMNSAVELRMGLDNGAFASVSQQLYQGTPLNFYVRDSAAGSVNYFFHILPPAGASACTIGGYSDTVSTAVTRVAKPMVVLSGNILQVTNPDTSESYAWQRLDSTAGVWQPGPPGTKDTLLQSGLYRVQATKSTCAVVSDTVTYSKPVSIGTPPPSSPDSATLRYYPNPATDMFVLDSLNLSDGWVTVEIVDAQTARRISIQSIANQTRVVLHVGYLNSGVYLAVLRRKDGSSKIIKFLKI